MVAQLITHPEIPAPFFKEITKAKEFQVKFESNYSALLATVQKHLKIELCSFAVPKW